MLLPWGLLAEAAARLRAALAAVLLLPVPCRVLLLSAALAAASGPASASLLRECLRDGGPEALPPTATAASEATDSFLTPVTLLTLLLLLSLLLL